MSGRILMLRLVLERTASVISSDAPQPELPGEQKINFESYFNDKQQ